MKRCPRCDRTYADTETFCETDGTALVPAAPAFVDQETGRAAGATGEETRIECPVCGGKAEPGEVICNFCGARLQPEEAAPGPAPGPGGETTRRFPSRDAATRIHDEAEFQPSPEEPTGKRNVLGVIGYLAAAAIALGAGAWLALHLSSGAKQEAATKASPSATVPGAPTALGPLVALANTLPVQVRGDGTSAPERSAEALRRVFGDNQGELLDVYNRTLAGDNKVTDGMLVRLHIQPDGTVDQAAVRGSTSPNPSLDAEVVKSVLGWKFAPFSGGSVEADYPIIFAPNAARAAKLESDLHTRLASLSPTEPAEYASAPAPVPASAASAAPSPAPEVARVPPSPPRATAAPAPPAVAPVPPVASAHTPVSRPRAPVAKPRATPRKMLAARTTPAPSLLQLVQDRLKSSRKLGRVRAYTAGDTVTLYGRVFDDNDKLFAERVVRGVPGVGKVVDTLTTDTAEWATEQDRITRQLQDAGLGKVTVKVIGHDAYLNGSVKTELEKQRAVTIAESAAPVTVRENLIRLEPGGMFGF